MAKQATGIPKSADWISSIPEVARLTGWNERTIRGWKSHPAWPFPQKGPIYIPGLRQWHEAVIVRAGEPGSLGKGDLERQRLEEDIAMRRLRRREREGSLIERALLDRFCSSIVGWTRDRIEQWVASIPAHFADSAGTRTILEGLYDRFCEDMQDQARHLRFHADGGRLEPENGRPRKQSSKVKAARRRHGKVRRR